MTKVLIGSLELHFPLEDAVIFRLGRWDCCSDSVLPVTPASCEPSLASAVRERRDESLKMVTAVRVEAHHNMPAMWAQDHWDCLQIWAHLLTHARLEVRITTEFRFFSVGPHHCAPNHTQRLQAEVPARVVITRFIRKRYFFNFISISTDFLISSQPALVFWPTSESFSSSINQNKHLINAINALLCVHTCSLTWLYICIFRCNIRFRVHVISLYACV